MAISSGATPLGALSAVVLDTETTGLDASTARIIEIAALRLSQGKPVADTPFHRRLNPGVAIEPGSTAVHGITSADLAGGPSFAQIAAELGALMGDGVVIGHRIGYDLRVLAREMSLAGLASPARRAIDIELLGRVAAPDLASHGLKQLAEWLAITLPPRRSVLDDVRATFQVFTALLPRLREKGIRTVAEAELACRTVAEGEVARLSPGSVASGTPASPLVSIDSFPYRHRVGELMSAPALILTPQTPLGEAVRLLVERKVSSVLVGEDTRVASLGILTERDVLRAIDAHGGGATGMTIGALAKRPLQSVLASDFVYRAIGRMDRLKLRHLVVADGNGDAVGVVTTRNLLRHRAQRAIVLGDEIDRAVNPGELAAAWGRLTGMAASLVAEGIDPRTVAAVVSAEICALTRRAAELAEARLQLEGWGPPPVPYALMVLGSAGRGESLLAADQDNAIVYATGAPGGREDTWFAELGRIVADIVDEAGVRYCKGGIMARNPEWRKSVADWKATVDTWVRRQRPEDLLNVDIFFDGVGVHGDPRLAEEIWSYAYMRGTAARDFVKLLSLQAAELKAPITIFGGIRTADNGRVDLKMGGIMPIFTAARVLSIRHDARTRATPARLDAVAAKGIIASTDAAVLIEAHRTILGFILAQQLADAEAGIALSSRVDLARLDREAQRRLREALGRVSIAQDLVTEGRL